MLNKFRVVLRKNSSLGKFSLAEKLARTTTMASRYYNITPLI